ncbi:allergen Tha p 1-like [Adelges cooleyi]|uniref:allergen Tha p 1-like n=1 Tax=Adelges cooleyi TaxID=133065 RepID=UPI0021801112|nr:allergen Tha p 1-like [Adelges cooleyi]
MSRLIVLSFALFCVSTVYTKAPNQKIQFTSSSGSYVSTYDHLDLTHLLKNDKLVSAYIRCFLDEGVCTSEGKQVKAVLLPEIISTVCSKCSEKQKTMARQVLNHIYVKRRPDFERIMQKYDKQGKYNEIVAFMNEGERTKSA